jgi:hypothetical protein
VDDLEDFTGVEGAGQSLDILLPSGHGVGLESVLKEHGGQPDCQGVEHGVVERRQAAQPAQDHVDQGQGADGAAGRIGGGGHLGGLARPEAVSLRAKDADLRGLGIE